MPKDGGQLYGQRTIQGQQGYVGLDIGGGWGDRKCVARVNPLQASDHPGKLREAEHSLKRDIIRAKKI